VRGHLNHVVNDIMSYYSGKQGYKDGNAHDHCYGFLLQICYYLQTGAVEKCRPHKDLGCSWIPTRSRSLPTTSASKLISFEAGCAKDDFLATGNAIEAIPDVDKMIMDAQGVPARISLAVTFERSRWMCSCSKRKSKPRIRFYYLVTLGCSKVIVRLDLNPSLLGLWLMDYAALSAIFSCR